MSCPEDLLDRSSALDEAERRILMSHAARCASCALEIGLPSALPQVTRKEVSTAIERVMRPAPRRWKPKHVAFLAAAAVLVCGAAMAAMESMHAKTTSAPPIATPAPRAQSEKPAATMSEPATVAIEDLPHMAMPLNNKPPLGETSSQLFARANKARQAGDTETSLATYKRLEVRWPASNEARVARVSVGRMLLEKNDPTNALSEFDAYLNAEPRGDLREDALVGKARACSMLSRKEDELSAWKSLVAEYPSSMYAARAQERISALR